MPQAKPWELFFHDAPPQPGDEQEGAWPRKQLRQMDKRFIARVQRAIERGEEHPTTAKRNPRDGEGSG
jgi:hypothetical protein